MAGVPINFQALSNVIPTYNFVDIVAGTGYINFYAGKTVDLNLLSNFTFYSDPPSKVDSLINASQTNALVADIDFDTLLNRPLNVAGKGIVNIPIGVNRWDGPSDCTMWAVVTLRKYSGSESDVVANTSTILTVTGSGTTYKILAVDLDIPLTHFKIGDILRLTVQYYITTGGNRVYAMYAHDPKNRSSDWDTTAAVPSQLAFQCPVRLNL